MEVGAGSGVVELVEEAADLSAAAGGRKAAAFGKQIDFRNACGTLMADDLNDTGHGVGAVERAFSTVHDFDFIDVIESEVGKEEVAAREIHGSAVDEDFGKAGIAAVDKDGRKAADGAGSRESDAGLRGE